MALSAASKQIAGPLKRRVLRGAMPVLTMPNSGHSVPRSMVMASRCATGRSKGRMTSGSATVTSARFSATVRPLTVIAPPSSSGSSCFISARQPPAASKVSITWSPTGRTPASTGVTGPSDSNRPYTSAPQPLSVATACRCLMQLTEPPTDSTARTALAKAPGVITSRGFRSSHTICTMRAPAARTVAHMAGLLAATGVLPGSAMPSASVAMCIELAVPMPEHTPGPRMALRLMPTTRSTSR